MNVFQNIQTKRKGLRCPIRVMNHSGDEVLTTYDPEVADSSKVATEDLQRFWDECVDEFKDRGTSLTPKVYGKKVGGTDFDLISGDEINAPEFDIALFDEVLVQPVPLSGG